MPDDDNKISATNIELLQQQINGLNRQLTHINSHYYIKAHNSLTRLLTFQFLRGLAFGFGSIIGATVLVSFMVYFLRNIDFIPIIGEWAKEIVLILQEKP